MRSCCGHWGMYGGIPGLCTMPVATISCDSQKCLQMLSDFPWGAKLPPVENHWARVMRARYDLDSQISRSKNKASHHKVRAVSAVISGKSLKNCWCIYSNTEDTNFFSPYFFLIFSHLW